MGELSWETGPILDCADAPAALPLRYPWDMQGGFQAIIYAADAKSFSQ